MKVKVHPIIVILVILIFAFLIFVTIDNIRTFYNNRKAIHEREKEYEKQRDARIAKEVENFKLILKRNQIMADSIADNYNQEFNYNYNIPIKAYFDKYSPYNKLVSEFELPFVDVPYYGLCDEDTTKGFIFSLHFPDRKQEIRIYRFLDKYSANGKFTEYIVQF